MNDIRHALRRLRATPVVTASAIACLAIGVWMTSITSAIGLGWFRPNLHLPEPDRVMWAREIGLYTTSEYAGVSPRVYETMRNDPGFAAVGYYSYYNSNVEGYDQLFRVLSYSSGMMGVTRVRPILGRGFIPSDDTTGGVIILSNRFWRVRYGADSNVVGRVIRLRDERPRTIIGVMPEGFSFPSRYAPDGFVSADWAWPGEPNFEPIRSVFARLADGADREEVEQRLRVVAERTLAADRQDETEWRRRIYKRKAPPPVARGGIDTRLERFRTFPDAPETLRLMLLILTCGFAVVAVAIANVVNLLLIRGAARRQEIAVRMALGAARWRVIRELVTETVLLAGPALVIGFTIAWAQWRSINPTFYARVWFGEIDARVTLIATMSALILALVAGVWPGLRATSMGLEQVLRDARRSGVTGSPLDGLLSRLVTGSTAATVMLLICAALLGFAARDAVNDLSRAQSGVLASDIAFDDPRDGAARMTTAKVTLANLRGLPGVASAAIGPVPVSGGGNQMEIYWSLSGEPNRRGVIEVYPVTDGYFETMGIQVLRGRVFSVREARDSSGLVVINRDFAGTLFGARNAVGSRFRFRQGNDSTVIDAEVIGVVENLTRYGGLKVAQMYRPYASSRTAGSALVLYRRRTLPQPKDVAAALRATPGITSTPVTTIAERTRRFDPMRHYMGIGFAMFAIVGLIIAIVGTYGVVAYSVVRRTHEIGVRLALGADGRKVSRMVIEQGMKITLVGIAVGVVLAAAAVRLLGGFIQDLEIGYGGAIGVVIALVCILSFVASAIPAIRAARLNPVDALRAD